MDNRMVQHSEASVARVGLKKVDITRIFCPKNNIGHVAVILQDLRCS